MNTKNTQGTQKKNENFIDNISLRTLRLKTKLRWTLIIFCVGLFAQTPTNSTKAIAYADSLKMLGNQLMDEGKFDEAKLLYEEGANISAKFNNKSMQAKCVGNIGNTFAGFDMHKAIAYYDSALVLAESVQDTLTMTIFRGNRGGRYVSLSQFEKAIEDLNFVTKHSSMPLLILNTNITLFAMEEKLGRLQNAINYLQNSVDLYDSFISFEDISIVGAYITTFLTYHEILVNYGEFDKSVQYIKKSESLLPYLQTQFNNNLFQGAIDGALGIRYFRQGNFSLATDFFNNAIEMSEKTNYFYNIFPTYHYYIGTIDMYSNNHEKAIQHLQIALEHFIKTDKEIALITFAGIVGCLLELGQLDEAEEQLNQWKQLSTSIKSLEHTYLLMSEANLQKAKLNYLDARKKYLNILTLMDQRFQNIPDFLQESFATNKFSDFREYIQNYFETLAQIQNTNPNEDISADINSIMELYNKYNLQLSFANTMSSLKFGGAEEELEMKNLVGWSEQITALERQLEEEYSKAKEEQSSERITNITAILDKTKTSYKTTQDYLLKTYPNKKLLFNKFDSETFTTQDKLNANQVVIQYLPMSDKIIILVATQKSTTFKIVPLSLDSLTATIKEYKNALANYESHYARRGTASPIIDWNTDEHINFKIVTLELSELLYKPIKDICKNYEQVLIAPSGVLLDFPFSALAAETSDGNLQFWIETQMIAYLPFGRIPDKPINPKRKNNRILAFTNSDNSLPCAGKEFNGIDSDIQLFCGLDAKESELKNILHSSNDNFNHLYFAVHTDFVENKPGLVLNSGDNENGFLDIKEIYLQNMENIDFVILNSCQSGLGEISQDESIMKSLADAFFVSGCKSVLATFWHIPDETSQSFIRNFYQELSNNNNKIESLQESQLEMIQNPETHHPFFWASYALSGRWD